MKHVRTCRHLSHGMKKMSYSPSLNEVYMSKYCTTFPYFVSAVHFALINVE